MTDQSMAPPVHELMVTRLVTFIVDVEALRRDEYFGTHDDGYEFDPQGAADSFIDESEGCDVDNYATIHSVRQVPRHDE